MAKLPLTLACWDYDRCQPLINGTVVPDGIDLNYLSLVVEETFFRMVRYREFDAAELSLSSFVVSLMQDEPPFIAIPVFPSRFFRHSCIFVSKRSGIERPEQLAGKRIGVPEYQMTAPVWIRGILQDEYGVEPTSCKYYSGGEEEPGREEKLKLALPEKFHLEPIPADKTLSQMLADGELDALHAARAPSTLYSRPNDVKRLFDDSPAIERAYFAKTKIFPIMHVIALRRDVYAANPWIAMSLYKAFERAKQLTYDGLIISAAAKTMLPWQIAQVEQVRRDMGADWWPYGVAPNRHVLETFLRYHHEQGLSHRLVSIDELFAPECREAFKI